MCKSMHNVSTERNDGAMLQTRGVDQRQYDLLRPSVEFACTAQFMHGIGRPSVVDVFSHEIL